LGLKECEEGQKEANSLKVHTVFVSPLRRALQTAYHLFKNHPNFSNIKFIIVPKAKEGIKA
jgi:phosphohistidine phosphatase SixA